MQTEYIIFGIKKGGTHEEVLISEKFGIRTMKEAKNVAKLLEMNHSCTNIRILVNDWSKPDFTKSITI